jgi:hypothetical protein
MSLGGGSTNDRELAKLIATVVGSACAGAALAVTILKVMQQEKARGTLETERMLRGRPSVIMSERDLFAGGERNEKLMPHQHEEKMRRKIQARALVEEDNFQPRNSVTVRVPATSANMGPGCMFFIYISRAVSHGMQSLTTPSLQMIRLEWRLTCGPKSP